MYNNLENHQETTMAIIFIQICNILEKNTKTFIWANNFQLNILRKNLQKL